MSQWLPLRRDLGVQLLALYLLFVGLVIAAALIFDALAGSRLEHDVKAADLALARSIALETNASLHNAQNTVAELSLAPEVQSGDIDRLPPLFAAIATARSEVNLVYLLDENGIMSNNPSRENYNIILSMHNAIQEVSPKGKHLEDSF